MDITSSFKCTEDALAFGALATPDQIIAMGKERMNALQNVDSLRKRGDLQAALDEACRAQLLREAMESYYESH